MKPLLLSFCFLLLSCGATTMLQTYNGSLTSQIDDLHVPNSVSIETVGAKSIPATNIRIGHALLHYVDTNGDSITAHLRTIKRISWPSANAGRSGLATGAITGGLFIGGIGYFVTGSPAEASKGMAFGAAICGGLGMMVGAIASYDAIVFVHN